MTRKKIGYTILFLCINFGGLWLGGLFMGNGPTSEWYLNMKKAPWTPAGWVFGVAWAGIMVFFSIYLTSFFMTSCSIKKSLLFASQVVLNVSWNFVFFNQHQAFWGLVVIGLLLVLLCYLFFAFYKEQGRMSFFLLPYITWLCLASSLNLYILIHN